MTIESSNDARSRAVQLRLIVVHVAILDKGIRVILYPLWNNFFN